MKNIGDRVAVKNAYTKEFENGKVIHVKTSFGETSYLVRRDMDGVEGWHHKSEVKQQRGFKMRQTIKIAYVEIKDGRFHVGPWNGEAYGIYFENQNDAEHIASAINNAFERGKEDVRSSLRDLIGAGREKKQ